ncbi:unnamed protein product [Agarophyton chilense]
MAENGETLEEEINRLLQTKRYDPLILPRLEQFVDYQLSTGFCDSDANLATLKLYQFYPAKYNSAIAAKILIKALMSLPATDFLACLYLIPERCQVDEPIPVITQLADLLERGHFHQFWAASGACRDLLDSVPGSFAAVREFMTDVVSRTYHTIHVSALAQILHLQPHQVLDHVASRAWTVADDIITIPPNEDNQPRPPSMDEQLSFKQVASNML